MKFDMKMTNTKELMKQLDKKAADTITYRALNKVGSQGKTEIERSIRTDYNIKKKDIGIKMTRANRNRLFVVFRASNKQLSLVKFGARQLKKGTRFSIKRGQKIVVKQAFRRMMGSGHDGVYRRRGKPRLPIRELTGPSAGQLMTRTETKQAVIKLLWRKWKYILRHEYDYYMSKKGKG